MAIQVVCPNGHPLKVSEASAGKVGLCPICKARVKVPQPEGRQLSEEAILDILGPHKPEASQTRPQAAGSGTRGGPDGAASSQRTCARCNREIVASLHVCPYCHTYIAGLSEG